jgi:hypothetical protein
LRINRGFKVSLDQGQTWMWLMELIGVETTAWKSVLWLGKERHSRLACTVLMAHEAGYADPWIVITDLVPDDAEVVWYRMRAWIEQGFRDLKHDGWQWQRTRLSTAERVERQWLVLAIATLVTVSLAEPDDDVFPARESLFAQGMRVVLRRLWGRRSLCCKPLCPLTWPTTFPASARISSKLSAPCLQKT